MEKENNNESKVIIQQGPILEQMNAKNYFSILTIFAILGLVILTPIGGKFGDLFGEQI